MKQLAKLALFATANLALTSVGCATRPTIAPRSTAISRSRSRSRAP